MKIKIFFTFFVFHHIHAAESKAYGETMIPSAITKTKKLPPIKEQKRQMSQLEKINANLEKLIAIHGQKNPDKQLISVSKEFSSPWIYVNTNPEYEFLLKIYYNPETPDTIATILYYPDPETFEQKFITKTSNPKDLNSSVQELLDIITTL